MTVHVFHVCVCVCSYGRHVNAAKKVGMRRGIAGGLSLFTVYFILFASFGVAFW